MQGTNYSSANFIDGWILNIAEYTLPVPKQKKKKDKKTNGETELFQESKTGWISQGEGWD